MLADACKQVIVGEAVIQRRREGIDLKTQKPDEPRHDKPEANVLCQHFAKAFFLLHAVTS